MTFSSFPKVPLNKPKRAKSIMSLFIEGVNKLLCKAKNYFLISKFIFAMVQLIHNLNTFSIAYLFV